MKIAGFRALGQFRPTFNNVLISGTKLLQNSYQSGRVFCSFRRKVLIPSGIELYMLEISQNQHAIWAMILLAGDNLLRRHTFRAASGQPIDMKFMICKRRVELRLKSYFCKLWEEILKFLKFQKLRESDPPIWICHRVGIYLFKINNGNTRTMCEIYSKFSVNVIDVFDIILVFLMLTLDKFDTLDWCFNWWLWASEYLLSNKRFFFLLSLSFLFLVFAEIVIQTCLYDIYHMVYQFDLYWMWCDNLSFRKGEQKCTKSLRYLLT